MSRVEKNEKRRAPVFGVADDALIGGGDAGTASEVEARGRAWAASIASRSALTRSRAAASRTATLFVHVFD